MPTWTFINQFRHFLWTFCPLYGPAGRGRSDDEGLWQAGIAISDGAADLGSGSAALRQGAGGEAAAGRSTLRIRPVPGSA